MVAFNTPFNWSFERLSMRDRALMVGMTTVGIVAFGLYPVQSALDISGTDF